MKSLLIVQADYVRSPIAVQTARNIVSAKIRNCEYMLTRSIATLRRSRAETAPVLAQLQARLSRQKDYSAFCPDTHRLSLLEARAAQTYYDAVRIITRQYSWRRLRGSTTDALNLLLNIGYHLLFLECEKSLTKVGLYVEVGFLHGTTSGRPLLYDFVEVFRQPCVDKITLPLFSRRHGALVVPKGKALFLKRFQEKLDMPHWYKGRCETMRRIILLEAYELKHCMTEGKVFTPYQHRWGNSSPCSKKKKRLA